MNCCWLRAWIINCPHPNLVEIEGRVLGHPLYLSLISPAFARQQAAAALDLFCFFLDRNTPVLVLAIRYGIT